ncbi:PARG [Acanthosepion pharaonis]|uniref:poly(ADP-ribose) glycohydrolase n=1 Tax=Acanthosepion pharaonis TaxID=158019 RepID=A0A812CF93_ACAPH|nr:PARG [Sepia pharaonis]
MNHGISPKKLKQSTLDELFGIKSSGKKSQTQKAETEYPTHKSAAGSENLNRMKCGSQDEDKRGSQDTCSEFDEDFSPAPALVTMSSQGDSGIHTQASIMTTDEENNIELQPSCFPLEKMNRAPACWTKEEEFITPDKDHSVMFTLPYDYDSEGDVQPKPSPANYTDCWGDHHVKMPCSIHNDYAVEGKLKQRWELIQLALMLKIKSSHDLEAAILKYNLRYKGMEESKREEFFEKQLPSMIKLALRLPYICTLPIPLLKKNTNRSITFSQEQVACLLANAFFCTFPRRNTFKRNSEYFNYPSINFTSLYQNVTPHTLEKLKCILHYFRRVTTKMPNGTVTFQRQCLKDFPDWVTSQRTLSQLYCSSKGTIEDTGPGFLEKQFLSSPFRSFLYFLFLSFLLFSFLYFPFPSISILSFLLFFSLFSVPFDGLYFFLLPSIHFYFPSFSFFLFFFSFLYFLFPSMIYLSFFLLSLPLLSVPFSVLCSLLCYFFPLPSITFIHSFLFLFSIPSIPFSIFCSFLSLLHFLFLPFLLHFLFLPFLLHFLFFLSLLHFLFLSLLHFLFLNFLFSISVLFLPFSSPFSVPPFLLHFLFLPFSSPFSVPSFSLLHFLFLPFLFSIFCSFLSLLHFLFLPFSSPFSVPSFLFSIFCSFLFSSPFSVPSFFSSPFSVPSFSSSIFCSFLFLLHFLFLPFSSPFSVPSFLFSIFCSFLSLLHFLFLPFSSPFSVPSFLSSIFCSFLFSSFNFLFFFLPFSSLKINFLSLLHFLFLFFFPPFFCSFLFFFSIFCFLPFSFSIFCSFLLILHFLFLPFSPPFSVPSFLSSIFCSFLSLLHFLFLPFSSPFSVPSFLFSIFCSLLSLLHFLFLPFSSPFSVPSFLFSIFCSFFSLLHFLFLPFLLHFLFLPFSSSPFFFPSFSLLHFLFLPFLFSIFSFLSFLSSSIFVPSFLFSIFCSFLFSPPFSVPSFLFSIFCFERFSNYSGYSSSFLWKGDYQDKSVRNSWGRRVSQLTCIDALIVSSYTNQFKQWHVVRELNKAYCGFYDKSEKKEANLPAVCTGNWGCGAFGGNHQLKALIQLMAASEAHRDVCYFTFKDKKLEKDLCDIHKFLTSRSISICQLMNLIEQYRQDVLNQKPLCSDEISLFDYIYQQCSAD